MAPEHILTLGKTFKMLGTAHLTAILVVDSRWGWAVFAACLIVLGSFLETLVESHYAGPHHNSGLGRIVSGGLQSHGKVVFVRKDDDE